MFSTVKNVLTKDHAMKLLTTIILLSLLFSCTNYQNKPKYTLKPNETVEVYFTLTGGVNVPLCLVNQSNLKHIEYLKIKTVEESPKDCAGGCEFTIAYVFKATSKGTDTLKFNYVPNFVVCDSVRPDTVLEQYIVEVR